MVVATSGKFVNFISPNTSLIMKKHNILSALIISFMATGGFAQNQAPVVAWLQAWADVPNNTLHVLFDLAENENEDMEIFLGVSANDTVYQINTSGLTGDIGYPVSRGVGKEIIWNYGTSHPDILSYKVRVTADDRYQIDIQSIVDQVDTMNLYQDLQWLSGKRDHGTNVQHLLDVRDSITNRFNSWNFEVSTQDFTLISKSGVNVIGRKAGVVEDSITYINDAHYDGVPIAPAADDNGSGVVGFLEVARILAPYNFRNNIRFIGFDREEDGLLGSLSYVNTGGIEKWEEIAGVFNFEMIGYYSERPNSQTTPVGFDIIFPDAYAALVADDFKGNFITNVACDSSLWIRAKYDSITSIFVPELKVISIVAPGNGTATVDLRRSDHAPFWDVSIQALMLTDGANFRNLNYHTATDVSDSLNFGFMGDNVKAVVANLCVLAGIQHSGVAYANVSATVETKEINLDRPVLHIYPNPTRDLVLIQVSGSGTSEIYTMEITDEAGRQVIKREVYLNSDGISLDVSKWKAGAYAVTIYGDGTSLSKGLIVQ